METREEWYKISNIDEIDSPALVIYLDRIKLNIQLLKSMIDSPDRLRPHVKTHKMLEVVELMMSSGIGKFKCATIAEAEMLGMAGAKDVLLAYQPVGPKIKRLLTLAQTFPETGFSCLVDNIPAANAISRVFLNSGLFIPVFIDLNVGMNRTGISPDQEALNLYLACESLKGIKPVGLHVYDGHIRDSDLAERKRKTDEAFAPVKALYDRLISKGRAPVIVAGGTPTFPIHAKREKIECSPGTFIFWDWGYANALPEQKFNFAGLVISRVISKIDNQTICLDLGHKSVAAENPLPRVKFLNFPTAEPVGQSEEHLVVKVKDASEIQIGDVFYGLPVHICPTCALYEKAFVVEGDFVKETWKVISRDRYIQI